MRLMSWNVLADGYVRPKFYPHTDPALLERGARTAAIIDAIAGDGVLCCLQEVEPALVGVARKRLAGWDIRFEQKRGKPDGVAMFAPPDIQLDSVDSITYSDGSTHVALFATVNGVTIATTHLRWDPPTTAHDQRFAVREITELLAIQPAVIAGDLNIEPDDAVYRMLIEAGFVDVHSAPTANPNGRAKRIDYILVQPPLRATALPTPLVEDTTPLPSGTMPSDHVPIGADIEIPEPETADA